MLRAIGFTLFRAIALAALTRFIFYRDYWAVPYVTLNGNFYDPDTFVVVVVDPADGQRDIASKRYFASGS